MRLFFVQALWLLLIFAALAVGVSALIGGAGGVAGAFAGVVLAVLDLGLLVLAAAMLRRRTGALGVGALGGFLALKFPILGGVLYVLVVPLALHPVGLALGFGCLPAALVAGILAGRLPTTLQMHNERSLG